MSTNPEEVQAGENGKFSLVKLTLLSLLTGAAIGVVIGCFRVALDNMNTARTDTILWAHQWPVLGFILVCSGVAATTAVAAWLVQRSGQPAAGSGIPHVEAVIEGKLPAAPLLLLPIKFVGGLLAIGGGLALGREGPSVQMGANLAQFRGSIFRLPTTDRIALLASGAGAGLAVAFNAPLAGAVFVLEELVRRFDIRIAIAALGTSCSAIAVAALLLGPLSYAAGTPGGLFAPILALSGCLGMGFGLLCPQFVADAGATPVTFAIAGMAAFLTATVRAPVTGMILIFEMTGAFNQALPMLWASFAAMAVPTLMGNSPIYDSMKVRTIGVAKAM